MFHAGVFFPEKETLSTKFEILHFVSKKDVMHAK